MPALHITVHAQSQPAVTHTFVSLMRRTMSVNPQENRGYFLRPPWAWVCSMQIAELRALGAKEARHAHQVISSLKIKHHSIFTTVSKITNKASSTQCCVLQNSQYQMMIFWLFCFVFLNLLKNSFFGDGRCVPTPEFTVAVGSPQLTSPSAALKEDGKRQTKLCQMFYHATSSESK